MRHYAGEVLYDCCTGFLEKNVDKFNPLFVDLLLTQGATHAGVGAASRAEHEPNDTVVPYKRIEGRIIVVLVVVLVVGCLSSDASPARAGPTGQRTAVAGSGAAKP